MPDENTVSATPQPNSVGATGEKSTVETAGSSTTDTGSFVGFPPSAPAGTGTVSKLNVLPGLARLDYNLWHHKTKLSLITALLVIESSLLPIALFYGLRLTTLRIGLVFAIITSFFGIVTGIEFGFRMLKLIKKNDNFRPIGGRRYRMDYTHHTLSVGYFFMSAILIGFSIPHSPWIRPLAIPVSYFYIQVGAQMLWSAIMHALGRPAPFRLSSVAKGEPMPPHVYTFVEDVIAVDGNAGKKFREAMKARYAASPRFRKMIAQQNWFWALGALADGIGTMVVIWTVPEVVAYGVGWGSPFIFAIVWTWISVVWVRHDLREEKRLWSHDVGRVAEDGIVAPATV